jgi:hypothetical protein
MFDLAKSGAMGVRAPLRSMRRERSRRERSQREAKYINLGDVSGAVRFT